MFKYIKQDINDWFRNPFKWNYFTYIFRRPYYRFRLFKRFCKYPYYGSWEQCDNILSYSFEIFCEFYEDNDIKNKFRIDIEKESEYGGQKDFAIYQNGCYDEMDKLYHWWTVEYKQREEELKVLLNTWYEHHVSWFSRCCDMGDDEKGFVQWYTAPQNKYAEYLHKMLTEEETKLENEKEEMLIRLIKIRNRLWD